jgi:hypothetical protein
MKDLRLPVSSLGTRAKIRIKERLKLNVEKPQEIKRKVGQFGTRVVNVEFLRWIVLCNPKL